MSENPNFLPNTFSGERAQNQDIREPNLLVLRMGVAPPPEIILWPVRHVFLSLNVSFSILEQVFYP